ncbi:hypothetical protein DFR71_6618 [Nocardia alba]|uniref:TY-Chap N-terminal domain-containing protein n=2 Tax=Nocardia alba TaxID=225051 RepID=A0A4R1F510_9NOCA|nr:hypothetical protein DFR71_6618 [Nocardia alba]
MLLATALDLVYPRAFAHTNGGSVSGIAKTGISVISVPVSGQSTASGSGWFESDGDAFAAIAQRLMGLFGSSDRYATGPVQAITWLGLASVVVSLEVSDGEIVLWLRNPRYQDWLDNAIEVEADDEDEDEEFYADRDSDSGKGQINDNIAGVTTAQVSSTDWRLLSRGLVKTLVRMPYHQVLILSAPGERFIQFEFLHHARRGVELLCQIAPNTEIDHRFRMSTAGEDQLEAGGWARPQEDGDNWRKSISWPAMRSDYDALATNALSILRDNLHVANPAQLSVEAWINWSSRLPDLTDLDIDIE